MEDANEILNKKVGTNEVPKNTLEAKKVKIVSVVVKDKKNDGEPMKVPMVEFMVKHPDREELLKINKIKVLEGEKLVVKACWIQTDDDGNFYKGSSVEAILSKLQTGTLSDTYGKEIDTVAESDSSPYLCLKAY